MYLLGGIVNTTRSEAVDWPYDEGSEHVQQEMDRDQRRMKEDIDEAWLLIISYLPLVMDKKLQDACKLIEWKL